VYSRLPVKDAQDYDILKDALLKGFILTEEGFKQKFRSVTPELGEATTQFIARLENYLMIWIDVANIDKDFDGLLSLTVKEQYLESCSGQLAIFLREKKPKDLNELAVLAEQYLDAHANRNVNRKPIDQRTGDEKFEERNERKNDKRDNDQKERTNDKRDDARNGRRNDRRDDRKCFVCGKKGNLARNCYHANKTAGMTDNQRSGYRRNERKSPVFERRNDSRNDRSKAETEDVVSKGKFAEADGMITRKAHDRARCSLCLNYPAHKCNAMEVSEIELKCGCICPVIADACCSGKESMPVCEGKMIDKIVSVLTYTGCSTMVVRRGLVNDDQLTGKNEMCFLIDGMTGHTPVAEIEIDTPFYKDKVKAVCMENPLYDVIIGNVVGVVDNAVSETVMQVDNADSETELQAVMTRSQVKRHEKPVKQLKVIDNLGDDVSRDKLIAMQQQDSSLMKLMKETEQDQTNTDLDIYFKMEDGILYRYCKNVDGREISQVVVPRD